MVMSATPRVHGVSTRCVSTRRTSSTTASTTHRTAAVNSSARKLVSTPSLIRLPSPPYDTSEPTVVSATVETVATRSPAMITGSASGSSIRSSSRPAPYPSPVADSRTSSGTDAQALEHAAHQDRERVERRVRSRPSSGRGR